MKVLWKFYFCYLTEIWIMQNLKRITFINIILYSIFIVLNIIELIWYSNQMVVNYHRIIMHNKISSTEALIQVEVTVHTVMNFVSYGVTMIQLFLFNSYVKRNNIGKSYHWLLIAVAFIPVIHFFLYYFIWRKLNRSILNSIGKRSKSSDRKIILMWVVVLIVSIISLIYPLLSDYVAATHGIFGSARLARMYVVFNALVLLCVSVIELLYLIEFQKELRNVGEELAENQLIDA
jgi:hypothetical protein